MKNNQVPKIPRDINLIPEDGYLVYPLSMSRLSNSQSPEECYKVLEYFEKKLKMISLDVIFLYTDGLYYNDNLPALELRKRTNNQMIAHRNSIMNIVLKKKKYIPQCMHFLPWDYILLNSPFIDLFNKLKKLSLSDKVFNKLLIEGLNGRDENEANLNFLLEELAVNHIIRQKLVDFPKTLVKKDNFRLIVYPGEYFKADLYLWKKKIFPQKTDFPYYASHYDLNKHLLYNFDEIEL